MGFKRPQIVLRLEFETTDPEFTDQETGEQLQVRIRSLSLRQYNALFNPFAAEYIDLDELPNEIEEAAKSGDGNAALAIVQKLREYDPVKKLYGAFANALIEWNMEDDDGEPVPTSYEGVCSLPPRMADKLIRAWKTAMTAVDNPLPLGSPNGEQSLKTEPLEQSIPMDAL